MRIFKSHPLIDLIWTITPALILILHQKIKYNKHIINNKVTLIAITLLWILSLPTSLHIYYVSPHYLLQSSCRFCKYMDSPPISIYPFLFLIASLTSILLLSYLIIKGTKGGIIAILYNHFIRLPYKERKQFIINLIKNMLSSFFLMWCVSYLLLTGFWCLAGLEENVANTLFFKLYARSVTLFPTLYITYIIRETYNNFIKQGTFYFPSMGIYNLDYSISRLLFTATSLYLADTYLRPLIKSFIRGYQLDYIIDRDYSTKSILNNVDIDKLYYTCIDVETVLFGTDSYTKKVGIENIEKWSLLNSFYITIVGGINHVKFVNYSIQYLHNTPFRFIKNYDSLYLDDKFENPYKYVIQDYIDNTSKSVCNKALILHKNPIKPSLILDNTAKDVVSKGLSLHINPFKPSHILLYNIIDVKNRIIIDDANSLPIVPKGTVVRVQEYPNIKEPILYYLTIDLDLVYRSAIDVIEWDRTRPRMGTTLSRDGVTLIPGITPLEETLSKLLIIERSISRINLDDNLYGYLTERGDDLREIVEAITNLRIRFTGIVYAYEPHWPTVANSYLCYMVRARVLSIYALRIIRPDYDPIPNLSRIYANVMFDPLEQSNGIETPATIVRLINEINQAWDDELSEEEEEEENGA